MQYYRIRKQNLDNGRRFIHFLWRRSLENNIQYFWIHGLTTSHLNLVCGGDFLFVYCYQKPNKCQMGCARSYSLQMGSASKLKVIQNSRYNNCIVEKTYVFWQVTMIRVNFIVITHRTLKALHFGPVNIFERVGICFTLTRWLWSKLKCTI